MNNYEDLKTALTDSRNPFVWVTDEGWSFHEVDNSKKFDAEKVLACESFEQLFTITETPEKVETTPVKTKKK